MKKLLVVTLLSTLSACGGGGGGGSSNNQVASPAPTVAITKTNGATVSSSAGSGDTITTSISNIAPLTTGQTRRTAINLSDFARKLLHLGESQTLQPLTATVSCPGGGSITAPDANATSGTVTFNACVGYLTTVTLDGSITFSASGDLASNYTATVTFQNFTITNGADVVTINVSMNISGTTVGTTVTTNVSYSKFSVTINSDYINIYNFHSTEIYDTSTLDYSLDWNYTFESSLINGVVKVATETPIVGNNANPYPYTGSVVFTGMNNSHTRVSTNNSTGLSTDTVMIEVDADGDGVYEDSQTMTWAQFESLGQVFLF